jgi:hypothetical protein
LQKEDGFMPTNSGHGRARVGAGRKRKALTAALNDGTTPKRIKQIQYENPPKDLAPEVLDYLKEPQKIGGQLESERIFRELWAWLCERKCEKYFDAQFLQDYALVCARCVQLERITTMQPFFADLKTLKAISSIERAWVNRVKIREQMHNMIMVTVKENCSQEYKGETDFNDPMERILRGIFD